MIELPPQSLLLAKVPPELRNIIWDYAFDAQTLHFEYVDDKLQCAWCDDSNDLTKLGFRHRCWNARRFISREGRRPLPSRPSTGQGQSRNSLLLVCKTIYSEARDSLYERTMFAARRTQSIRELPRMLPASLQCVRALQLSTAFQYPVNLSPTTSSAMRPPLDDTAQWTETCRVLASFARLSTLDITLALWPLNPSRRDTPISVDSLAALLDPLRTVRADRFTVTVTSNVPPDVRARLLQVPFELQIRDRPGIGYYTASSDD